MISSRKILSSVALGFALTVISTKAAESLKPQLNQPGKLLIDGFKKGEGESGFGKLWKIGNGSWDLQDGVATALRGKGDDHSAGLRSNVGTLPNRLILEYKFRFDTADGNKGSHKNNVRFMGNGKAFVFHPTSSGLSGRTMLAEGGTKKLFEKNVKLENDRWYSVMIELRDEACCVQVGGIGRFDGQHEQIKERKKKFFVFNIGKAKASIKDVKLCVAK